MSILINFKICDNSEDCNGIEVCPTKAIYWNEKKRAIKIDNSKCISCGKCESACPVGAIRVAKTEREYEKIKREIANDKRKVSDLFVDKYGAQPIHSGFLIPEDKFNVQILRSTKPAVAEFFRRESIQCLLRSIPIKSLFKDMNIKYRKVKLEGNALVKKYGVGSLPSLLFFNNGKLAGKIEGYYEDSQEKELKSKIEKILQKIKIS